MARDPAVARYFALTAMRIGASLVMVLGIVLLAGGIATIDPATARIVGVGCVVAGALDLMLVMPMLARRWRSPPPP